MEKRTVKKLSLNVNTVRYLTEPEMSEVKGAAVNLNGPLTPVPFSSWLICCISYGTAAMQCCLSTT
jgi:hypothetical protein